MIKAYFMCGSCNRQAQIEFEGTIRCPHCNSTKTKHLLVGSSPPEWFNKPQKDVKSALEHGMQSYAGAMQKLSEGDK
ncbi:hypothetical protein CIB91_002569 [Salmonella enterica subsp. enterica serovar Johannesburg]|nr:hypothetical protein [Salmonella enterica subsp. enterica serovar Johannesburg]